MSFKKITEEPSPHRHLEKKTMREILEGMNQEDRKVPDAVATCIPVVEKFLDQLIPKMQQGGRLFYIGAGTSGRLGIIDASECPPTFGVSDDMVIGLIAGGDRAIRKAVEFAEDSTTGAWKDLSAYYIDSLDTVVGLAASGTTPYVVHGLKECKAHGIGTACICCNPDSPASEYADYKIEVIVGPEFISGSTRLKSGTAQKLVLNMISTALMIGLGRVHDNKMVHMQLSNRKLVLRGIAMIREAFEISEEEAEHLLKKHGSVRACLDILRT